jgi:DNA-binding FadR family transcriptional regulator
MLRSLAVTSHSQADSKDPRRGNRPPRKLAADPIFEALARAILRGKYAPGDALPPERELAALFNVSRLIVRQALHRLRGMWLVSGGQGGQNTVLDPDASNDMRIVALTMELAPEKTEERDVVERQLLGGFMLLELAEMRMTDEELGELDAMVREVESSGDVDREMSNFDTRFWTFVAAATDNKILLREARWWFELLQHQPERRRRFYGRPEMRLGMYRTLVESLKSRRGRAATDFLAAVHPALEARDR